MTLEEYVHQTLRDDATIRTLTGKGTPFYGVYMEFPEVIPDPPYITHQNIGESEDINFPKGMRGYAFTIWGDTRETIKNRIKAIFHEESKCLTDYKVIRIVYDHSGPDLYDDQVKSYFITVYFNYTWIQN